MSKELKTEKQDGLSDDEEEEKKSPAEEAIWNKINAFLKEHHLTAF